METPAVTAVVLTRGDRNDQLQRALGSIRSQLDTDIHLVVVVNGPNSTGSDPETGAGGTGGPTTALSAGIARTADEVLELPDNVGIPEGRNLGARHAGGDAVVFLDDDAELLDPHTVADATRRLVADPSLAVVGLRIVDHEGATSQRHVPRLGGSRAGESGPVAGFLGGAVVVRRQAFDEVGGYAGPFFYAMEESDLALRLAAAGWSLWYDADHPVRHPRVAPSRHPDAARHTARNRMWMVHRNLPMAVAVVHVMAWLGITTLRQPRQFGAVVRGYWQGLRHPLGPRQPISWRTVWHLTRLGRPPVL